MKFCDKAWNASLPTYKAILRMPFIRELVSGSLPRESFNFYLEQDAVYLMDFSSFLGVLASKMHKTQHKIKCLKFAQHALEAELMLHEKYIGNKSGIIKEPACAYYTDFLHRAVSEGDCVEGMAVLLPCFTIYKKVGDEVYREANLHQNPYKDWIEMYSGEDFAQEVKAAEELMNELAADATNEKRLLSLYQTSSKLEYLFWDYAYTRKKWDDLIG